MFRIRRLTHRWMRQRQYFQAHFESAPYDTPASVWSFISENQAKTQNLKQNVTTKYQKVVWVRIVRRGVERRRNNMKAKGLTLLYQRWWWSNFEIHQLEWSRLPQNWNSWIIWTRPNRTNFSGTIFSLLGDKNKIVPRRGCPPNVSN